MSVSAIASLRPLQGQCLRKAHTGLLSVHIRSRSASLHIRATVALPPQQRRWQSDLKPGHAASNVPKNEAQKPSQPQKLTFRQFTGRAVTVLIRNLGYLLNPRAFRQAFRESPVTISLILVLLAFTVLFSAVQIRLFYNTFYNPTISRYPEPLATTLRRAIYYTTVSPNPEKALKFYQKAMVETRELEMDPSSDEVLGIRIMVAFWMEKNNHFRQSAEVLESVRRDCLEWVDTIEQQIKDGKVGEDGRLKPEAGPVIQLAPSTDNTGPSPKAEVEKQEAQKGEHNEEEEEEEEETVYHRRERLLKKAVSTSVKLGELYADPHVLDPDSSHRHLVWSVETALKEFRRRREEGTKPGEEQWLTPTEVGATMESLGRDYERKSQFHLAIPLFFQGLRNCESPCHRAVIMNNLAACFAQHPIYSPTDGGADSPETQSLKVLFDSSMPNTRKDCLEAAANWARNAYVHAKDVEGDDRTPECDEACAVALCNWGDVAAMQGNMVLAKKKYTQCIELSNKLEFPQGVKQAQQGLKKLAEASSKRK